MAYSKGHYDGPNGVHGVPMWRIAGYALNNTATNAYLILTAYMTYYLTGFVGVGVFLAGSFSTIMRVWDGVTDPFVGLLVDKTDGRFGKNRPFMVIGNAILFVTSFIMFHVTHLLPEVVRLPFFFLMSALFYIGYTCQCVVTKSAQSCLTNDPKQRPIFSVFDGAYNLVVLGALGVAVSSYIVPKYGTLYDPGVFHEVWLMVGLVSVLFTAIAVISLAPKDNKKYYGLGGGGAPITLRDYWDVIRHNRAIQMLVLAGSTDKLATNARTSAITVVLYGVVVGNFALSGVFNMYTSIGAVVFMVLGAGFFATRFGQRKALLYASIGALITQILLTGVWLVFDPTTFSLPGDGRFAGFNLGSILLLVLTVVSYGLTSIAGNLVIPMTADCADYETYRSGRYVPGLMGTLFSFVDKLISSLAPLVTSLLFMLIGFRDQMPDVDTHYSDSLKFVGLFVTYGLVAVGLICNIVAMKFYPLTKEKMDEVREAIAQIKAKQAEAQPQ